MGSDPGRKTHHATLRWNPALEDCTSLPELIITDDPFFTIFRQRRRRLVNGDAPVGLTADRAPQGRAWRACENRLREVPAWERAQHYRELMETNGYRSVRALALAVGKDHAGIARVLKILDLPEAVLSALREHSDDVRIRRQFTGRRLRSMLAKGRSEGEILYEIEKVLAAGQIPAIGS